MPYLPLLSPDDARALIEKARAIITAEGQPNLNRLLENASNLIMFVQAATAHLALARLDNANLDVLVRQANQYSKSGGYKRNNLLLKELSLLLAEWLTGTLDDHKKHVNQFKHAASAKVAAQVRKQTDSMIASKGPAPQEEPKKKKKAKASEKEAKPPRADTIIFFDGNKLSAADVNTILESLDSCGIGARRDDRTLDSAQGPAPHLLLTLASFCSRRRGRRQVDDG